MNKCRFIVSVFLLLSLNTISKAQNNPVMYFCERYDTAKGEININDRFKKGDITIMIKCGHDIGFRNIHIKFDQYNCNNRAFEFYKKFNFTVIPKMNYIFFSKNEESDLSFEQTGFYRVCLLNDGGDTVASAILQIVE